MDMFTADRKRIKEAAEEKSGLRASYVQPIISGLWAHVNMVDGSEVAVYSRDLR